MENINMMTVGELAKRANVSIRTLQYYDKINLLKPTKLSDGGRRLYSSNDMAILHQIITLKCLGFSLEDIKGRFMPVDTSSDVIKVLNQQEEIITEQVSRLQKTLESIRLLSKEINETNNIDWSKYAKMINLINQNNEHYWVIKHLDEDVLDSIVEEFEKYGEEDLPSDWWKKCCEKAVELDSKGISPESLEGQELAKVWWDIVMKLTNGNVELLGKLVEFHGGMDE